MDDLAKIIVGIYIVIAIVVGTTWPVWIWFI